MNKTDLKNDLVKIGLERNMKILLHEKKKKIGHVDNGPKDLIEAIE